MPTRVLILGTGLIGASIGLALKAQSSEHEVTVLGWDPNPAELATAFKIGAIDGALADRAAVLQPNVADIYVLAAPVLPILDWMEQLALALGPHQLVTDVGSTKAVIVDRARQLFNQPDRARFLPGHPMAGKESGGAAIADANLFQGATWLFTPMDSAATLDNADNASSFSLETIIEASGSHQPDDMHPLDRRWHTLVEAMGARVLEIAPQRHDEVCAWVSHLPQMLSTALAALLQDTFSADPKGMAAVQAIGGRALRETTRLGSSPYSMWRDIALTNTVPIANSLQALEQRLQHMRENLRTPELREEFSTANRFRAK